MFKPVDPNPDFIEIEKKWLKKWYANGIVDKYLKKNQTSKKYFSFLDGPITANNPMGVHHAWGRTYKDLWQRYNNMRGKKQRFQNGFDAQGLWVEVEVEKELGFKSKKDIETYGIDKFVNKCKDRVLKFAKIQTDQSKRLGYFMDWDNSYVTMSDDNNYMIWHFLKRCYDKGWVYKGRDSVPWCPRCGTAISQHEILTEDYTELKHESVYFKLKIEKGKLKKKSQLSNVKCQIFLVAWTTTPWTIPANVALAVNPDYKYGIWEKEDKSEAIIIFDSAPKEYSVKISPESILGDHRLKEYKKIDTLSGKELAGLKYEAAFDNLPRVKKIQNENTKRFHAVVEAKDLVTSEEGTAILHVAPGAGQEDFQLSKEKNIPVIDVIDEEANYLGNMGDFSGKNGKNNPELIIKYLATYNEGQHLLRTQKITHRYPRCWRCKTELVWRVVDEWYIAMDRNTQMHNSEKTKEQKIVNSKTQTLANIKTRKTPKGDADKTLREQMVEVTKTINWIPGFGLDRELDWLKNMHDWMISKKRYWGLALPIYECKKCGSFEVIGSKNELKDRAIEGWDKFNGHSPHRPWVDEVKIRCNTCSELVERIKDVGNPWLDAGIVPYSTISKDNKSASLYTANKKDWRKWFPADFITESFPGQFKNWFYSLIAMSTVLENERPFKTVLGFGTLTAEDGEPMHKSSGNMIEFSEGANKIGADVMRWVYSTTDPKANLPFGYNKADTARRQFHLLLWNIYAFYVLYANLDKWKPSKNALKPINILDRWILSRLNNAILESTNSLETFNPVKGAVAIEKLVQDASRWFIRRSRDRVGIVADDKKDKESFYNTTYFFLTSICRLLAPFTPFIAEEIYFSLTGKKSVHLADWPGINKKHINSGIEKEMALIREIVELGHSARNEANIKVRQPLGKIEIRINESYVSKLDNIEYRKLIKDELNVKKIIWVKNNDYTKIYLDTKITDNLKAEGEAREIIRQIQIARKKAGCKLDKLIDVEISDWPLDYEVEIKKQTLTQNLIRGKKLNILRP